MRSQGGAPSRLLGPSGRRRFMLLSLLPPAAALPRGHDAHAVSARRLAVRQFSRRPVRRSTARERVPVACTCEHAMRSQGGAPSRLLGPFGRRRFMLLSLLPPAGGLTPWSRCSSSSSPDVAQHGFRSAPMVHVAGATTGPSGLPCAPPPVRLGALAALRHSRQWSDRLVLGKAAPRAPQHGSARARFVFWGILPV